jgi:hypothetical protein
MTLGVALNKDGKSQRQLIQDWLQEICSAARVNLTTGVITLDKVAGRNTSGCDCLKAMIDDKSHKVTIQPLTGPGQGVPGTDHKIGEYCGGYADPHDPAKAVPKANGKSGDGSDATVYIDISNNAGTGYDEALRKLTGQKDIKCPMWIVLAHELTTGHARQALTGTWPRTNIGKLDYDKSEAMAIQSENGYRRAREMVERQQPK